MHREDEHYCGLGMNALVIVCSGNTTVIMVGHGCSGDRMLWEHDRYYGSGMDALALLNPKPPFLRSC